VSQRKKTPKPANILEDRTDSDVSEGDDFKETESKPKGTKRALQYDGDEEDDNVHAIESLFQQPAVQPATVLSSVSPLANFLKGNPYNMPGNKENTSPQINVPQIQSLLSSPQKTVQAKFRGMAKFKQLWTEELDSNYNSCVTLLSKLDSRSCGGDVVNSALEVFEIDKDVKELIDTLERIERSPLYNY